MYHLSPSLGVLCVYSFLRTPETNHKRSCVETLSFLDPMFKNALRRAIVTRYYLSSPNPFISLRFLKFILCNALLAFDVVGDLQVYTQSCMFCCMTVHVHSSHGRVYCCTTNYYILFLFSLFPFADPYLH